MGDRRGAHKVLEGRPKRKRTLGKPRPTREDNIKIYFQKKGRGYGHD
jgi:hypothetical protein